jgi:hypothetical protein
VRLVSEKDVAISTKTKNMYVVWERSVGIYPIKILMHNSTPKKRMNGQKLRPDLRLASRGHRFFDGGFQLRDLGR